MDQDHDSTKGLILLISLHKEARGFTCAPLEMTTSSVVIDDLDNYPPYMEAKRGLKIKLRDFLVRGRSSGG